MKKILYFAAALCLGLSLASCADDIVVDHVDEGAYANVENLVATLRDSKTNKVSNIVDLRQDAYQTSVAVALGRAPKKGVDVTVEYDAAYLDAYNQEHGTSFQLYPQDKFSIQNGGQIVVAPDETRSYSLDITLQPFDTKEEATYLLPLKAVVSTDGVKASEDESHLVYLVRNMSWQSSAARKEGEKSVICFFEVNDTNPLNTLCFETEDGRLLFDYVVLFAYNINYDREKGEVYVFSNPQCQYILDHYDEVIKPLRERGVKVILSILGNHDESGLAQLSDLGARDFAQKVAAVVNGYGFDGINYDDEYSNGPDLSNPLFAQHSVERGDRLYFETKKALPDKIMMSYQFGSALGRYPVDGVDPSEYMDIFVADYGGRGQAYGNSTLDMCSYMSSEFARNRSLPNESSLDGFLASEYRYWMVFAVWGVNNTGGQSHWNTLNTMAQKVLGSPLKKPEYYWPETKSLETKPITW